MKKELFLVFKSIFTTSLVSLAIALCVNVIWDKNIYAVFGLSFICQYFLWALINDFLIKSKIIKLQELELNKIEQLSTLLSCSSCSTSNIVTFIPDDNSRFEFACENCKGKNVVNMNFTVARVTEINNN